MVNVGGRSKGCSTCRKRRVKCDESRPICLRCQKGGLECNGPRDVTFVVGNIVKSRRRPSSPIEDAAKDTSMELFGYQVPKFQLPINNEFEIYICYALNHLRRGGLIELTTRNIKSTDITPVRATAQNARISHQAVLSFAAIFFGTQHRQAHIARLGYAMHGVVLQRLNQALSGPKCNIDDEIVYAVVTLGILEIFVSTGPGNHLKHMAGLERLLELRDHDTSISPVTLEMYRSLRQMIIFAALRSRKASILAQPEWKERMRVDVDSKEELQLQELYDILADCTVLIAERDQTLENPQLSFEKRTAQLDRLKQHALDLLAQLFAWRKEWNSDIKHIYTEIPITKLSPTQTDYGDGDPLPFATTICFPNETVGLTVMLFNISLIYVLQVLALLTSLSPQTVPDESPLQSTAPTPDENILHDPPYFQNIWSSTSLSDHLSHHPTYHTTLNQYITAQRDPILEICRSLPYHISLYHITSSAILHWAISAICIKLGGNESVVGRWVIRLVVGRSPIVAKTLGVLAG